TPIVIVVRGHLVIVVKRDLRIVIKSFLPARTIGPPEDCTEGDEGKNTAQAAHVVNIHGDYRLVVTVPSCCRYATRASISGMPSTASLAPSISSSVYGTPTIRRASIFFGVIRPSTLYSNSQG